MSRTGRKLKAIASAALFGGAFWLAASSAPVLADGDAHDFMVQYDQARLLRLDTPAADVIVGNPSIADVAVQGGKLLVITGKTFGVTNLIVLDPAGQVITNRRLVVRADDQKIVNLARGTMKESYNCAPRCRPVLAIGDENTYYQRIAKSTDDKFKISESGVNGVSGGE